MSIKYPDQYYVNKLSELIEDINPLFRNIIFEFWVCFYGAVALSHPRIRAILIESYGLNADSFIDFFDKETGLAIKMKSDGFESKIKIDNFLKIKTNSLCIEVFEQLKRSNLDEKVKRYDKNLFLFLRHLRNASAHDNTFNLKNKDDSWRSDLECTWRDKSITRDLHKTNLHDFFQYSLALLIIQDISYLLDNYDS